MPKNYLKMSRLREIGEKIMKETTVLVDRMTSICDDAGGEKVK
jgi:hypothetical protein